MTPVEPELVSPQQQRLNAIKILTDAMVEAGVAPDDAAKFAPVLVDKELAGEKTL